MSTFLFDNCVIGPIKSRRLGLSLGINPVRGGKLCSFDCLYCECGWNADGRGGKYYSVDEIAQGIATKLGEFTPDHITFAGNGEPTMHPKFDQIVDKVIELRNSLCPKAKIAVLTNATMIDRPAIFEALLRVDSAILKLDSAIEATVSKLNQPNAERSTAQTIELMKRFNGKCVIQTMFVRGDNFDNTTADEVSAWVQAVIQIAPRQVMLYSLDRDTPSTTLQKVSVAEMEIIAHQLGDIPYTIA